MRRRHSGGRKRIAAAAQAKFPDQAETMKWIPLIGFTAAALTTLAFLPQVIKTWKIRETKDISLLMYVAFVVGVFLWFCYGILIGDYPVSIANGITLLLASIILIAKIKYG